VFKNLHTHTANRKTVSCYKTDPSSPQGRRPTANKTAAVLTTTKIWSWDLEGLNTKTDGWTDWLGVSCNVTLTLTLLCLYLNL